VAQLVDRIPDDAALCHLWDMFGREDGALDLAG
jgi:hypothetical protein